MGQIKVEKAPIEGLYVIEPTVHFDSRGYFMETYSLRDMDENGLGMEFVQDNQSMSSKGVLRGLHYQIQHPQGKLVRVIRGAVFDVAVDIMQSDERGVFHATNTGFCSWYELAGFVFDEARRLGHREYDDVVVKPVPSSGYPTKARRPRNSRMDCRRLSECGFTPLPDWRDAAGRFIKELGY